MIEVEHLSAGYSATRHALDGVSFRVERGEVVGLLGANGAGKTTLLRTLAGLLHPRAGRAQIAGFDVVTQARAARHALGYVPEEPVLDTEFRVAEFLDLRAALKGVPAAERRLRVEEVSHRIGLLEHRRTLIAQLSKGYRQRVALADALLAQPPVLLLDEPTDGLDPSQRAQTLRLIADLALRHTVLLSTHILPEAESVCQRLLILDRGRLLAEGAPACLLPAAASASPLLLHCQGPADQICEAVRHVEGVVAVRLLAPAWQVAPAPAPAGAALAAGVEAMLQIDLADAGDRQAADRIARVVLPMGRLLSLAPQHRSLAALLRQPTHPPESNRHA